MINKELLRVRVSKMGILDPPTGFLRVAAILSNHPAYRVTFKNHPAYSHAVL